MFKEIQRRHENMKKLLEDFKGVELPNDFSEKFPYMAKKVNELYQDRAELIQLVERMKHLIENGITIANDPEEFYDIPGLLKELE